MKTNFKIQVNYGTDWFDFRDVTKASLQTRKAAVKKWRASADSHTKIRLVKTTTKIIKV